MRQQDTSGPGPLRRAAPWARSRAASARGIHSPGALVTEHSPGSRS